MPPVERWWVAVALGGQGRYAAAATVLQALLVDARVPVAVAAHAAVTLAAHRRQVGGHRGAQRFDAWGLRLSSACRSLIGRDGYDGPSAHVDALIGLAADALGTGAPDVAARLLDAADAADAAGSASSWRLTARSGWVRAELALLRGAVGSAVMPAERALAAACEAGALRHVLKSRIVLAVARSAADVDGPAAAVAELCSIATEAEHLGLLPLVWPARLAAADLTGGRAAHELRRHAFATLTVIEQRSDPVAQRRMGDWMPSLRGIG